MIHPDEWVDREVLRAAVEAELGFTYAQIREVYRQGRKSAAQIELRDQIDARLLAISESGGNMAALATCLGFRRKNNGTFRTIENALTRARAQESRCFESKKGRRQH